MQRLKSAFRFIGLNLKMALSHEAIQKPWMYFSLGSVLLTFTWLIPIGMLLIFLGSRALVWILIGVIALLCLLSLLIWGEITALCTAQRFASLIRKHEDQPVLDSPWVVFRAHWMAILVYVLSRPALVFMLGVRESSSKSSRPNQAWKKAHPLIPSMIALEDLELKEAVARLKDIVAKNYLRFQPGYLPVGWVARTVQWVSILFGAAAGVFIAMRIADPLSAGSLRTFWGTGVGLVVIGAFSTAGIAFSTFIRACYHSALYVWALEIQDAQIQSGDRTASPPEILSQAMWKKPTNRKERSDAAET